MINKMVILSDKIVITRKKHQCSACERVFEAGTKMRKQVNTFDGIGTWRECPTCQLLLSEYRERFSDYDNTCSYGCVSEELNWEQTPEDLLIQLDLAEVLKNTTLIYFRLMR